MKQFQLLIILPLSCAQISKNSKHLPMHISHNLAPSITPKFTEVPFSMYCTMSWNIILSFLQETSILNHFWFFASVLFEQFHPEEPNTYEYKTIKFTCKYLNMLTYWFFELANSIYPFHSFPQSFAWLSLPWEECLPLSSRGDGLPSKHKRFCIPFYIFIQPHFQRCNFSW